MGPSWVTVRDSSARQTLRAVDKETLDVVARFDQLVNFAGMSLSRRLGVLVRPVLAAKELADQTARLQAQAALVARMGQLNGSLHVPNAAAPLDLVVDLRANRVDCSVTLDAPREGRAGTRVNWLLRQLKDAPPQLQVRASAARSRDAGPSLSLGDLSSKTKSLVSGQNADIRSFTLTLSQSAGTKRGQGNGSFVASVTGLVDRFYGEVVQQLKVWSPSAPKVKPSETSASDGIVIDGEHAAVADELTSGPAPSMVVAELVSASSGDEGEMSLEDEVGEASAGAMDATVAETDVSCEPLDADADADADADTDTDTDGDGVPAARSPWSW
jgi:hypothetical protein